MRTLFIALRALIFVLGFVLLWGWAALSVRAYDRSLGILLPAWTELLGIIFIVIGGILVVLCVGIFVVRGRGTPAVFDAPREFVVVGPYKYVRNPMYIGALTMLIGFGLYQHSISILVFSLLWLLVLELFVVYFEEPNLKNRFGAKYQDYCKTVPRWIPRW